MIRFYNSINKKKEDFIPIDDHHVGLYVCGPTVYDRIHLGNARPLVVFDILSRLLRHDFDQVTYVRNLTDIDDKIIDRASMKGCSTDALVTKTIADFHQDCADLGVLPPNHEPRATEYLDDMIAMISRLVAQEHAYVTEGHVLFDASSYSGYGQLSGRSLEEQIDGVRIDVATYKRHARDFVLWKPSTQDQPGWDSPWGRGRPGWHIECSVMSASLLGNDFDIHGGGRDLLFPHHENERAQSCCVHPDSQFARYWLHNGFVTVNKEKMAKSLGNFTTLRQLLDQFSGDAIRLQLLSTHYRKPLDFNLGKIQQSIRLLHNWQHCIQQAEPLPSVVVDDAFLKALRDDLNTPLAIARLSSLAKTDIAALKACLKFWGLSPQHRTTPEELKLNSYHTEFDNLLAARQAARKAKDFAAADKIRDQLLTQGLEIIDTPTGSTLRYLK